MITWIKKLNKNIDNAVEKLLKDRKDKRDEAVDKFLKDQKDKSDKKDEEIKELVGRLKNSYQALEKENKKLKAEAKKSGKAAIKSIQNPSTSGSNVIPTNFFGPPPPPPMPPMPPPFLQTSAQVDSGGAISEVMRIIDERHEGKKKPKGTKLRLQSNTGQVTTGKKVRGDMSKNTISINGKSFSVLGGSVQISDNRVFVDGKEVMTDELEGIVEIKWDGEVADLRTDCSAVVHGDVHGNANSKMSLTCGDVHGDATSKMSLTCGNIEGNATSKMSLTCKTVKGNAKAGMSIHGI